MSAPLATVSYIGATILFALSLGGLSNPESSRRANLYGMIGMTIAMLATVLGPPLPQRETAADARIGCAGAQAGGFRVDPGRFRELHRSGSLGAFRGDREDHP